MPLNEERIGAMVMRKQEGKEPTLLDRYLSAEWPAVRRRGRSRFILMHYVLPFGTPAALILTGWEYRQLDYRASDLLTLGGLAVVYLCFFFSVSAASLHGAIAWRKREDAYLKEHGLESESENPNKGD
jgi:hypothetical protein